MSVRLNFREKRFLKRKVASRVREVRLARSYPDVPDHLLPNEMGVISGADRKVSRFFVEKNRTYTVPPGAFLGQTILVIGPYKEQLINANHVRAMQPLPGGKVVVASDMFENDIMMWDGEKFAEMDGGMNDSVNDLLLLPNGSLYACGDFDRAGDVEDCGHIARWNMSTSKWERVGISTDREITKMRYHAATGRIWCCGRFSTVNHIMTGRMCSFNPVTSSVYTIPQDIFQNEWDYPHSFAFLPNDDIVMAGYFSSMRGQVSTRNIGIYRPSEDHVYTLYHTAFDVFYYVETSGGKVFAAGDKLKVWDVAGEEMVMNETVDETYWMGKMPDGKLLLSLSSSYDFVSEGGDRWRRTGILDPVTLTWSKVFDAEGRHITHRVIFGVIPGSNQLVFANRSGSHTGTVLTGSFAVRGTRTNSVMLHDMWHNLVWDGDEWCVVDWEFDD